MPDTTENRLPDGLGEALVGERGPEVYLPPSPGRGILKVTTTLLEELLHFPPGYRIVAVSWGDGPSHDQKPCGEIALIVESQALPPVPSGCKLPTLDGAIHSPRMEITVHVEPSSGR